MNESRDLIEHQTELERENARLVREITGLKDEYASKLRILTAQEAINRIIIETTDLDEMLRKALDLMLDVLECDRAWLIYPCVAKSPSFRIPMERTRPEWPGANKLNYEIERSIFSSDVIKRSLATKGPLCHDPENFTVNTERKELKLFHIQSLMFMAIYPKFGSPWLLGIHHCAEARIYSETDRLLFEMIGNRISDGLSSLLALRHEKRLFEMSEVSIWNEDMSAVRRELDHLRDMGIKDLRKHLTENPQVARDLLKEIKVIEVNKSTLQLFEFDTQEEFLSSYDQLFGRGMMSVYIDAICAVWENKETFRAEAVFHTRTGEKIDAFFSFKIPDNKDAFDVVPVSVIDIRDRKVLEEQVRRSQKMDAVGQLTGGLAHDFNNILGIIYGNLELLETMVEGDVSALARVEAGLAGAARGAELTRKLLNFSSKDAEGSKRVSVNTLIEDTEELLAKSLTVSVDLKIKLGADIWPVKVDPGDFQDAVINLALNARDAMPGGGAVVIETTNQSLDEDYFKNNPTGVAGDYVVLSVRDTGAGMTAEVKERVLEPFFTTKEHGKGTGLGLSMVYGFAGRSNGHLEIQSEPGEGSTIYLYLPRAREKKTENPVSDVKKAALPGGDETILVVDDENELRGIAVLHLQNLGYQVLEAESARQALEVMKNEKKIDLLFSDIVMPGGLDGYQLAGQVYETYPDCKILLTSGFNNKLEDYLTGDNPYLSHLAKNLLNKPYNKKDIALNIRKALDGEP